MTLRLDPSLLEDYLLGSPYGGPGLLRRIERVVMAQRSPDAPRFRTGSIIPTGSIAPEADDSAFSETTFPLLVALIQWQGAGIRADNGTEARLASFLAHNHISDVDCLVGPSGHLERARQRLKLLLSDVRERASGQALDRVNELTDFLRDWLGNTCEHQWELFQEVKGAGLTVYRCACESRRVETKEGQWVAV